MNKGLLKVLEVLGNEIVNLELDIEIRDYEIKSLKEKIKNIEDHINDYCEGDK